MVEGVDRIREWHNSRGWFGLVRFGSPIAAHRERYDQAVDEPREYDERATEKPSKIYWLEFLLFNSAIA